MYVYYRNHYFQSSKGHNSKGSLRFLCFVPQFMMLYICFIKISGTVLNLQSGHEYKVEMVIFNIFYVQRTATPKVG